MLRVVVLLILASPSMAADLPPETERVRSLFSRKGSQGGGAGGVVEEWTLTDKHTLVLLYINDEEQPDSHGVFVVDTRSREPILTLGFMGSYAGQDTCRNFVSAKPGEVVVSTNGCMYGGDERTKFSFDVASGRVQRQKVSPPEPPQLRSRSVGASIETAVDGTIYNVTHRGVRRGDETVFELPASSEASCTRARLYNCEHRWIKDSTRVSSVLVYDGRIWVGLEISNGEGYQGIGGLGFFDTKTGKAGLLRHPVLVGLSTISFDVNAREIRVVNQPSYEGVPSPFEAVYVMRIGRSALHPGGAHLRDWSPEERKAIERLGPDQFMIDRYAWEHEQAKQPRGALPRE